MDFFEIFWATYIPLVVLTGYLFASVAWSALRGVSNQQKRWFWTSEKPGCVAVVHTPKGASVLALAHRQNNRM